MWNLLLEVVGPSSVPRALIEIFHITPTRATMVQKSTKYVKYTVRFPMGNFPLFVACTNSTIK